jgi:hypothetical protein
VLSQEKSAGGDFQCPFQHPALIYDLNYIFPGGVDNSRIKPARRVGKDCAAGSPVLAELFTPGLLTHVATLSEVRR